VFLTEVSGMYRGQAGESTSRLSLSAAIYVLTAPAIYALSAPAIYVLTAQRSQNRMRSRMRRRSADSSLLLWAKRSKSLLTFARNLPSATLTNLHFVLRNAAWFADWFCAKVVLSVYGHFFPSVISFLAAPALSVLTAQRSMLYQRLVLSLSKQAIYVLSALAVLKSE